MMRWIQGLGQSTDLPRSRSQYVTSVNMENFLGSLYFIVKSTAGDISDLLAIIHKTENRMNKFCIGGVQPRLPEKCT